MILDISHFLSPDLFYKFLRFAIVGCSGMIVDFGVTWLLKEKAKVKPLIANAIGFILAATSNYILNRVWTFQSTKSNVALEFTQFFVISIIGLALNTFIVWLLSRKFKMNFYISKLFAIGIVTVWNFFANLLITFA